MVFNGSSYVRWCIWHRIRLLRNVNFVAIIRHNYSL
jgi:hypothetical protein